MIENIRIDKFNDVYEIENEKFEIYPCCRSEYSWYTDGDSAMFISRLDSTYYFKYNKKTGYDGVIKRINKILKKEGILIEIIKSEEFKNK